MFEPGVTPQIIVATKPTELLQSKGEPKLSPIPRTELLYMSNSQNDIFLVLGAQTYYALISGRWFTAKALAGPWSFVPPKSLPADFAKIPADHPMADVLMSVPGTTQAREAAIANQIPQTATVQRDVQPSPVAYDGGEPQVEADRRHAAQLRPQHPRAGDPRRPEVLLHGAERRLVLRHRAAGPLCGGDRGAGGDLQHPGELAGALRHLRARVQQHADARCSSATRRATTAR